MTEVQIDSSQLPPVQDVCRDFAVLEDGALAYCLQEQEIEQHYASNIQKNQLVQRDIRIAKKLQDVEEEESRLQASEEQKQIEENDSKIARAIQEDIRRQAEESRRREERDQEIAKWLQDLEEEESCLQKQRRRSLARTRERSSSSHHPNNPRVLDRGQEGAREDGCFCPPMTQHPPQAVDCQTGPCEQSRMRAPRPQDTEGPLGSLTLDWPANISRDIAGGTRCPPRHSASLRVYCTKTGRGGEAPGRRPTLPSRGREHGDCIWVQSSSAAKTWWRQHPRDKSLPPSLGSGCHIEHLSRGSKRRPVPEESQSSLHHAHRPAKEGIQDLCSDDGIEPLSWTMAELDLQNQKQLQQDEELAQRLQEEEQARVRARQNQERHDDYRAAQVAQDEEIARYMQDQELKAQWSSLDKDPKAESIEEAHSLPGRRPSQSQESYQKGALKNCEAASLLRVQPLDRSDVPTRGGPTSAKPQLCRNIAEDLDPTFQAKRTEPPTADQAVLCSQGAGPAHPVPVDGFFDYLDDVSESTFVSPTKRQPEKVGRQKSKEKKEGCKQQ